MLPKNAPFLAIISVVILFPLLLVSCGGNNDVLKEVKSPDGNSRLVLFKKHGDMVTQNSLHVAILKTDEDLEPETNGSLLIADAGFDRRAFEGQFNMIWKGNDTIVLRYNSRLNVLTTKTDFNGLVVQHAIY